MIIKNKGGAVYIMTTPNRRVLYTGVIADLCRRVWEHKQKVNPKSFSARYNCVVLVYYALFDRIEDAIAEEKRIKGCSRQYKDTLIDSMNKDWRDLWADIQG